MKTLSKEQRTQILLGELATQRVVMSNATTLADMIVAYETSVKILKKLKKLEDAK